MRGRRRRLAQRGRCGLARGRGGEFSWALWRRSSRVHSNLPGYRILGIGSKRNAVRTLTDDLEAQPLVEPSCWISFEDAEFNGFAFRSRFSNELRHKLCANTSPLPIR